MTIGTKKILMGRVRVFRGHRTVGRRAQRPARRRFLGNTDLERTAARTARVAVFSCLDSAVHRNGYCRLSRVEDGRRRPCRFVTRLLFATGDQRAVAALFLPFGMASVRLLVDSVADRRRLVYHTSLCRTLHHSRVAARPLSCVAVVRRVFELGILCVKPLKKRGCRMTASFFTVRP